MIKTLKISFVILVLSLVLGSCTKEIVLDLDGSEKRIVIDAEVVFDDADSLHLNLFAHITQTNGFYESNIFDSITDAQIEIIDEYNHHFLLSHVGHGYYTASVILQDSVIGKNFSMETTIEGQLYQAQSVMPAKVTLDSLWVKHLPFGPPNWEFPTPVAFFTDIPNEKNFYKLTLYVNGVSRLGAGITPDIGYDGEMIPYPLFGVEIYPGDQITVELETISEETFKYYEVMNQMAGGGSFIAAPGNPPTNIIGNALGLFSAHCSDTLQIKLP